MPAHERARRIAHLSELLVLAEPDDPTALRALGEALDDLCIEAAASGDSVLSTAAGAAAADAFGIASGTADDPAASFSRVAAAITAMQGSLRPVPASVSPDDDDDLLNEFVARATEHLDAAEENLLELEKDPQDSEALASVFRAFHTIKGMTGFLALDEIQVLAHEGESLLEPVRREGQPLDHGMLDGAFAQIDALRQAVNEIAQERAAEASGVVESGTREAGAKAPSQGRPTAAVRETVRVDAERLDQLLDAVGELVIAESMASRAASVEAGGSTNLAQQIGRLDKLTRQLHEMAGSLRMVPLRSTFQRLARATRDVAQRSGKQVSFETNGMETELDKAVADRIADPLLHLVRNAVDHGIESDAAARIALGKPAEGRVEVRAYHRAGSIFVEVEDDGRGLDRTRIVAKARELGLLAETEQPTDRDVLALLFRPGFSTTEIVTNVSGRGVGMDVVKRTIDALSGQVTVRSEIGQGTTFTLRLPITLAVIDGMVVRVGDARYIVPTLSVVRSVRPEAGEITTVLGRGEVLSTAEELLRLVKLRSLFRLPADDDELADSIVMIAESDGERAGLVVDEIVGQQQIVIKSLGQALGDVVGVSGGAVMPDGEVGLILDVEGLVMLANEG